MKRVKLCEQIYGERKQRPHIEGMNPETLTHEDPIF